MSSRRRPDSGRCAPRWDRGRRGVLRRRRDALDFEPSPSTIEPATTSAASTGSETEPVAPAATGEITILADSAQPLDRRLFGTNVPAWLGPERLADPKFQAATTALGTTLLRFPGGSWSNGYDWLACERGVEPDCFATWAADRATSSGSWRQQDCPACGRRRSAAPPRRPRPPSRSSTATSTTTVRSASTARAATGRRSASGLACGPPAGIPSRPRIDAVGGRQRGVRRQAVGRARVRGVRLGGRVDVRRHPIRRWRRDPRRVPRVPRRDARRRSRHRSRRGRFLRRRELGVNWGDRGDRRCRRRRSTSIVIHHYGFDGEPDAGAALAVAEHSVAGV